MLCVTAVMDKVFLCSIIMIIIVISKAEHCIRRGFPLTCTMAHQVTNVLISTTADFIILFMDDIRIGSGLCEEINCSIFSCYSSTYCFNVLIHKEYKVMQRRGELQSNANYR